LDVGGAIWRVAGERQSLRAVDQVSFEVARGQIIGIIGPNSIMSV
jgi:ABC-type branched-subunit amino acid transport system ATPase component